MLVVTRQAHNQRVLICEKLSECPPGPRLVIEPSKNGLPQIGQSSDFFNRFLGIRSSPA